MPAMKAARRGVGIAAVVMSLAAAACGGAAESTEPAQAGSKDTGLSLQDARREVCSLGGGSVRVVVSIPEGFALARTPEGCMVAEEHGRVPSFVTVSAIGVDEAGPEHELGEPDGVLAWVEATGLLGDDLARVGEGRTELLGSPVDYVRVVGEPQGLGVRREVALMSVRQTSYHVVVMVVYPPGDEPARARTMGLLEGISSK